MNDDVSNIVDSAATQQTLRRVATNLFRSDITNRYYAIFKRGGKQIRRSLRTTDRQIAERRRDDMRCGVERLTTQDGRKLPFAEYDDDSVLIGGLARQWIEVVGAEVEPSTRDRYVENIKQLAKSFGRMSVAGIGLTHIEAWRISRTDCSANTYNKEMEVLRRIMKYAVLHGLRLNDPTDGIKHRKGDKKRILIPSHSEYDALIGQMIANGAESSARLCVLLALSGCRQSEITGNKKYKKPPMLVRDINFDRREFSVSKGKNHEPRTAPLFPAMEKFLRQWFVELPQPLDPNQRIIPIASAKTAIETACRKLGLPQFGHHTMRHVFVSNAIEAGIDFKAIADWVGHRDGGILAAKTYGHLRNEHSQTMAQRMNGGLGAFGIGQPINVQTSNNKAV